MQILLLGAGVGLLAVLCSVLDSFVQAGTKSWQDNHSQVSLHSSSSRKASSEVSLESSRACDWASASLASIVETVSGTGGLGGGRWEVYLAWSGSHTHLENHGWCSTCTRHWRVGKGVLVSEQRGRIQGRWAMYVCPIRHCILMQAKGGIIGSGETFKYCRAPLSAVELPGQYSDISNDLHYFGGRQCLRNTTVPLSSRILEFIHCWAPLR